MSDSRPCPVCGSIHSGHFHDSNGAAADTSEREVRFARVLNGRQWRDKPLFPPRDRDDVVPND